MKITDGLPPDMNFAKELVAFLEWLRKRQGLYLCEVGYAGEMLESGREHDDLVSAFMKELAKENH